MDSMDKCRCSLQICVVNLITLLFSMGDAAFDAIIRIYFNCCLNVTSLNATNCTKLMIHNLDRTTLPYLFPNFEIYQWLIGIILPILVTFYAGAWSDKNNRKSPMLVASIVSLISCSVIFGTDLIERSYYLVILIAMLINGLSGKTCLFMTITLSIISDQGLKDSQMTCVFALNIASHIAGNTIGNCLADKIAYLYYQEVFGIISSFILMVMLLTVLGIKRDNNIVPKQTDETEGNKLCLMSTFMRHYWNVLQNYKLVLLLILCILQQACYSGDKMIGKNLLTKLSYSLTWTGKMIQDYDLVKLTLLLLGILLMMPLITIISKKKNTFVLIFGVSCEIAIYTTVGISVTLTLTWLIYLRVFVDLFYCIILAGILILLVNFTVENERGKAIAVLTINMIVFGELGSILFDKMHQISETFFRGLVHILFATLLLISLVILLFIYLYTTKRDKEDVTERNNYETIKSEENFNICNEQTYGTTDNR